MATEYKLSYTAAEIDRKLGKVDTLVSSINGISPDANGNVELEVGSNSDIPTKTSQLENDSGFINETDFNEISEDIAIIMNACHTHSNSTVLDKISDDNGVIMYDNAPIGATKIKRKDIANDWADGVMIANNYGNDIIFMIAEPLGDNTKIIDISIKYDNVDYSYLELVDNQILSGNASLYISRKSILNETWGYCMVAMINGVDNNSPIFQDMSIEGGLTQGFTIYYEEVEYVENNQRDI
jgi:hypothetical protein